MKTAALITGATGAIGQTLCTQYAANTAQSIDCLYVTASDQNNLDQLAQKLMALYPIEIIPIVADLNQNEQIKSLFKFIQQQGTGLQHLVHCAGVLKESPLMMSREQDITEQIQINFTSSLYLAQQSAKFMLREKQGVMTFISSVVATQGAVGQAVYSASKSALHGLTKSLAKELGSFGVRVNVIVPGFIDTPFVAQYTPSQKQDLVNRTSLKRLGQPADVTHLIEFLHSPQASYITGQLFAVDGGLSL